MKLLFSGLVMLTLFVTLATVPTGCTKTNTVRDTLIVTSYADSAGVHVWDSLWAYYPFNGNTNDTSGNNHVLTLVNGPAMGIDLYGNANGSLSFPGGGAYAEIADGANFTFANFSISAFVKPAPNSTNGKVTGFWFSKCNWNTALGSTFNIGVDPAYASDSIKVNIATNTEVCTVTPGPGYSDTNHVMEDPNTTVQANVWYHVLYTVNNGLASLYIDGNLVNTYTIPNGGYDCSGAPFIIGNFWAQDTQAAFTGTMDDLRIYSRAITAKEVQYIYRTYMNRWGQ
jgi:hypothetical protein